MANKEHLQILKQGVKVWNQWRKNNNNVEPDLSNSDLEGADLRYMDLSHTNLVYANMITANLSHADLSHADLICARLIGAKLSGVKLPTNLYKADLNSVSLSKMNLNKAFLNLADLSEAKLCDANLCQAHLIGVNFSKSDLSNTNLKEADLSGANLSRVILSNANLERADLRYAIFSNANLTNANFDEAEIGWTTFSNNNLSVVKGLDSMYHRGPSSISIDTLYKSGGNIPVVFLRGCGVPDDFIAFLSSVIGTQQKTQFFSCFISYSHKDDEFSKRLYARLRDAQIRVWFAPEDVRGGEKLHEQIERAIHTHEKLIIVLSENSLQSEWVMTEIRKARKAEIEEKRRIFFPIRLVNFDAIKEWECFDSDSGKDLAVEVREYFIPDFSNWKDHDAFETSFDRLLRDLKAE